MVAAGVTIVVLQAGCTGDDPAPTKGDLLRWLETENSDGEQADPACVVERMWDARLSANEIREFTDNVEFPSRLDVYVEARDGCNRDAPAEARPAARLRP